MRVDVKIHFGETGVNRLNTHLEEVITVLSSSSMAYDFSTTKDEKGGQYLNVVSEAEVIRKVMALFS